MPRRYHTRNHKPFYLIPIMMGMAGVLFSSQLEDPILQGIVVSLSLAIPLFVGGNVLARLHTGGLQRVLLILGMATLTAGALVTVSGYSDSLVESEMVTPAVGLMSRYLGMGSLLLGLLVVLYTMVRSDALIVEIGDRFNQLADHMGEGFVLMDSDWTVIQVNPSFVRMTGIPKEEIIGRRPIDFSGERGAEQIRRHAKKREQGKPIEYEFTWRLNDEEHFFLVSETPIYDRKQRRVGRLATVRDITEPRLLSARLERYTQGLQELVEDRTAKLRDSERRFRGLVVSMKEGFFTLDSEHRIVFSNDRVNELLGTDRETIIGRPIGDFVVAEDLPRLRRALERIALGRPHHTNQEYALQRGDGTTLAVKVSVAALDDGADNADYSMVVTDVRELKAIQKDLELHARGLERANEDLRQLDRAKDVFLSNVSHELRTPLNTLDGYIEMLQSESLGTNSAPQTGALQVMARNIERLSAMINEMIEFSRMEIRGVRLYEVLFSPKALIDEALASAHPAAVNKDVHLRADSSASLPYMWGDRDKLGQVLAILLSNAIKFSDEGDDVEIGVSSTDDGAVVFSVTDHGIGIHPDYQERIFLKFYQVDSSMTRHHEGTGIGLSIAKNIVCAHHGAIDIRSDLREGSTFSVRLPNALFALDQLSEDGLNLTGCTIYIANRQLEFALTLRGALERLGGSAQVFRSGYECVRAAREHQPDLILVGEALADLSGLETVELLLQEAGTADMPIVLFRTLGVAPEEGLLRITRDVVILEKPFSVEKFREAMLSALGELGVGGARFTGRA